MKRKVLIIFITLIICGIGFVIYSNKKIEGVWINHYNTSVSTDYFSPGRDVLKIKNQTFHSYNHQANGGLIKEKYFLIGKSLRLWPKDSTDYTLPKVFVNRDSLFFEFYNEHRRIYKKIPDSLKNNSYFKLDFTNKAFRLESEKGIDTNYFDSKLTYYRRKDHPHIDWYTGGWETVSIDNYDFLLLADATPVIIKENNGNVLLYVLDEKNKLLKIKLVEIQLDSTDLKSLARHKKYYVDR
ncbi:hypothetical protein [Flagellimonas eckloniae]|uniref:Uncharacterized protein n=1 Tax=Flagellimonas eckloniae TaxID=346185 RepID=A0A0Q1DPZ0_9FLAO|nr:hypothetical protein [Allomuricauda eckloniae]KQC31038.1 hypothetical protein AAY42_14885 [Allomuricauda eckloniae]KQC31498.1 hypothetical protein AAY42_17680 [Allomuricauda eckloniae]